MPSVYTTLGDISYSSQGSGQPLILLHATLHSRDDFDAIIPQLEKTYRVIAVDWPWHGESPGLSTVDKLSAPALANVLYEFVELLKLPPSIVIGNSVGGFAAAHLAINYPEKVMALILVNSGGFIEWTTFSRLFCKILGVPALVRQLMPLLIPRYMATLSALDKEIVKRTTARSKSALGSEVAAALWRSFPTEEHDLSKKGIRIIAPTLIIWGTKDTTSPIDVGQYVQRCIPGSKLETLKTGHVVFASKPNEFLHLVESFLQELNSNAIYNP